ncbi:MAG: methyltransferase domain-containing protein [Bacteroidota bacterium]
MKQRSLKKELLDQDMIPRDDLFRNLYELDVINKKLGGHAVTLKGLKQLQLRKDKTYKILDIGSGGGDTLKAIATWAADKGYSVELTGVDLKADCIDYARQCCAAFNNITFLQADYRKLPELNMEFDIIITSLFCHHLTGEELVSLFSWCSRQAKIAFIMNDLHRHPLAYYSIALFTRLFSRSYLVKNDAKLSVWRGFKKRELEGLVLQSRLSACETKIYWCWAFRWLLIIRSNDK